MDPDALLKDLEDDARALVELHFRIYKLQGLLNTQSRYIQELERQLEPSVIAEIKAELEAQENERAERKS
jgi:hypothetical protein